MWIPLTLTCPVKKDSLYFNCVECLIEKYKVKKKKKSKKQKAKSKNQTRK